MQGNSRKQGWAPTSEANIIIVVQSVNRIQLPSNVIFIRGAEQIMDCWVFWITPKHVGCFFLPSSASVGTHQFKFQYHFRLSTSYHILVWLVNIFNGNDGKMPVVAEIS